VAALALSLSSCTTYTSINRESDNTYVLTGYIWGWFILPFGPFPFIYEGQYDANSRTLNVRKVTKRS
jgi:hypothetical protein